MTKLKPLQLGNLCLTSNIVQAPLAGVSFAPFRRLLWQHGTPGFCATPMISALDLVNRRHKINPLTYRYADEGPVCYQLSGNDPDILANATRIVSDLGADLIDLNCGCPMRKIRNKGCGSQLLNDPERLERLITGIKQNTSVPVSIKIRVGDNNHAIVKAAENGSADFIIVHGRNWTERYDTPCRYDDIKSIVKMTALPVIGNGDVACRTSLTNMMQSTGCAGAMIARGSIGNPWMFKQLEHPETQSPDANTIGELFYQHIVMLSELLSEKIALLHARRLAKYYACHNTAQLQIQLNDCHSLPHFSNVVKQYY